MRRLNPGPVWTGLEAAQLAGPNQGNTRATSLT